MERQYHGKSAGFRSTVMISTGACLLTIMLKEIGNHGNADRMAAIGMGIDADYYFAAAAASVLIIFVLAIQPYAENKIDVLRLTRIYILKRSFTGNCAEQYETLMLQQGPIKKGTAQVKQNEDISITCEVRGKRYSLNEFCRVVANDYTVKRFKF